MRSRWYHRPLLHTITTEKRATWLELFYDLIFVAAFIQLGNALSEKVSPIGFIAFFGAFVPLWMVWTGFTFFINRFTIDDFVHRVLVFLQMFAVGGIAIAAGGVASGHHQAFAQAAAFAHLIIAAMYFRAYRQVPEARQYCGYWGAVFFAAALLWFGSSFMPYSVAPWFWFVPSLIVIIAPMSRVSRTLRDRFPLDMHHLAERYGLLTIIVLGESFVKVLSGLSDHPDGTTYLKASIVLIITCGIWWVYFDDIAGSDLRAGPGKWMVWLYSHLPLQLGIIAVGVAIQYAAHFTFEAPAPAPYRWLLSGSLALVYMAVASIDSVTERRQAELSDRARVNARWISGVLVLILAPVGNSLSGGAFLSVVAGVCIFQVFFDMALAPYQEHAPSEIGKRSMAELAQSPRPVGQRVRRDVADAVRKNAPSELRRDLYFYFIEGSWPRVFVGLGILFVIVNIFFAALYLLEPGAIANARPDNFLDAFAFSVETMATIGYGAMAPASDYAHLIVTIEATVSIIGVAIVTGLVFTKAARPKSAVLFSKPLVLTTMNGKPTLMFRAGNARGNDIVDARLNFSVVLEDVSPEGHHLRRLQELKMARSQSPMFVISWTAMHTIDEHSPLHGVDLNGGDGKIVTFVATILGHDGTYNQTVYARHMWYPEDVRVNQRFVDILSELEDGRIMIDYGFFHDTVADAG